MQKSEEKTCIGCGVLFTPKWFKAIYCSISCSKKGQRNPCWEGKNTSNYEKIEFTCEVCNKQYIPKEIRDNRPNRFCSAKCSKTGENNPQFKSEGYGYNALHSFMRRKISMPTKCDGCGNEDKLDLANISNEYKREVSDWEWLCRKCHMTKDGRMNNLKQYSTKLTTNEPTL